jgi:hypothetical protein
VPFHPTTADNDGSLSSVFADFIAESLGVGNRDDGNALQIQVTVDSGN